MGNTIASVETHAGGDVKDRLAAAIAQMRELPASAPTVHKALKLMDNTDFAIADLKRILMGDQAVAARILRLANSAYFGFRSDVQTVSQAVVLLGEKRVRTLLQRLLTDKLWLDLAHGRSAAAPLRRLSLATATAACTLSQLLAREDAEELLLAGLLHNIGDLVFLAKFPAEYDRLCQLALTRPRSEVEEDVFGISSGRAGRLLLETWDFPLLYAAVVEHCDNPLSRDCPWEFAPATAYIHAAKKLAEGLIGGLDVSEAVQRVSPDVCSTFQLESDLLAEVFQCLPERMSLEQLQAGRS